MVCAPVFVALCSCRLVCLSPGCGSTVNASAAFAPILLPHELELNVGVGIGVTFLTAMRAVERSTPLQGHGHVSRHAAGKIDDLDPELVSALAKVLRPELIDFLGHARQRVFPARLLLIDGTTFVSAELVRKTVNLHLGQAVADRPLDDLDGASNSLLVGNAGGLAHMIDQGLLL